MAEELLHIRRSYQIEGDRRWVYWSAVALREDGEWIIASSQPVPRGDPPLETRLQLYDAPERTTVWQFENEYHLAWQGKQLVEKLKAEGWEPVEKNAHGQVIRMRRSAG